MTSSHSAAQATAQPGYPASAKATVPATVQTSPHTLSQNRIRRALRAVTGSLPVRIVLTAAHARIRSATFVPVPSGSPEPAVAHTFE
ncbi:hypothetical protein GCM10010293_09440 [Streptomyces griseoflavus]|nr:hypothetical protein GCM10010293_09440 [Streptomyces griseoflavus]